MGGREGGRGSESGRGRGREEESGERARERGERERTRAREEGGRESDVLTRLCARKCRHAYVSKITRLRAYMLTCSLRCTIARIFSGKCAKSRVFSGKCAKSRIFSERAHTRRQRGLACALSRQKTHKNRRFTLPLQSGIINRQYKPAMRLERRRFVRESVSAMREAARARACAGVCARRRACARRRRLHSRGAPRGGARIFVRRWAVGEVSAALRCNICALSREVGNAPL